MQILASPKIRSSSLAPVDSRGAPDSPGSVQTPATCHTLSFHSMLAKAVGILVLWDSASNNSFKGKPHRCFKHPCGSWAAPLNSGVRPHSERSRVIKIVEKRFSELAQQLVELERTRQTKYSEFSGSYEQVDPELMLNWCVKARSLLSNACGKESEHYQSFVKAEEPSSYGGTYETFKRIRAVFGAAREDFEGGYLVAIRNLVQAEIADSELDQARELHKSGYSSAAAVVAGVVLETTLRTLCDSHNVPHGKLDKMNSDLAKAGQYNSLMQKRVTALAAIRNSAAHGKTNEFTVSDVEAMIADVERFAQASFP